MPYGQDLEERPPKYERDGMVKVERIEPVRPMFRVTLELTEAEARDIASLCGHIGGDPVKSARRVTQAIQQQLNEAGVISSNTVTGDVCFSRL